MGIEEVAHHLGQILGRTSRVVSSTKGDHKSDIWAHLITTGNDWRSSKAISDGIDTPVEAVRIALEALHEEGRVTMSAAPEEPHVRIWRALPWYRSNMRQTAARAQRQSIETEEKMRLGRYEWERQKERDARKSGME